MEKTILRSCFALLGAVVLPAVFAAGDPEKIKAMCKEQWGTKYQMAVFCIDKYTESAAKVGELIGSFPADSEERQIVARCAKQWVDDKGREKWDMVEYCAEQQINAYEKLK